MRHIEYYICIWFLIYIFLDTFSKMKNIWRNLQKMTAYSCVNIHLIEVFSMITVDKVSSGPHIDHPPSEVPLMEWESRNSFQSLWLSSCLLVEIQPSVRFRKLLLSVSCSVVVANDLGTLSLVPNRLGIQILKNFHVSGRCHHPYPIKNQQVPSVRAFYLTSLTSTKLSK